MSGVWRNRSGAFPLAGFGPSVDDRSRKPSWRGGIFRPKHARLPAKEKVDAGGQGLSLNFSKNLYIGV
jgi:hypothetical protein